MKVRIHKHALERIDTRFGGVRTAIIEHYRDLYKRVRKGITKRRPCPAVPSRDKHIEFVEGVGKVMFIFDYTERLLITVFPPGQFARIAGEWIRLETITGQNHDSSH